MTSTQLQFADAPAEIYEQGFDRPHKILPIRGTRVEIDEKSVKLYLNGKLLALWERREKR